MLCVRLFGLIAIKREDLNSELRGKKPSLSGRDVQKMLAWKIPLKMVLTKPEK